MKTILLALSLLVGVVCSAQKPEYKEKRMDINYNEYISHSGIGWIVGPNGTYENIVSFMNFTDDVLEVRFSMPAIGVDTIYIVPPTAHWGDDYYPSVEFHLGYNLIPFQGALINPMLVEMSVDQPGYSFTHRYIFFRGAKKYYK